MNTTKKNHPILNKIYDILAELQNQVEQIILCKAHAHIWIKKNEEAYLIQTYTWPSGGLETPNDKECGRTVLVN